jgi:hypothetical protein
VNATNPPAYPLRRRLDDDRFTTVLVREVADVLTRHGYPPLGSANDLLHLTNLLHDAIYHQKGNP